VTVTVAMPWRGAPELLPRAVHSVLAQTVKDLRLVVVADGERIGARLFHSLTDGGSWGPDERLVLYRIETSHGPYFAQEVVLEATSSEWYAVVGADDWVDPDHLERLIAVADPTGAAVPGAVWWHEDEMPDPRYPFVHVGRYEVGVYRPERLRAIGGFNVAERIGQDSLTLKLLDLTGGMAVVDWATYHRTRRPDSLTTSPETGFRTRTRNEMRRRNRGVYAKAQRLAAGRGFPLKLARWRRSQMPKALREEAAMHADTLRKIIG